MVDATTSPIPRPNRRQSQTKSRPKTAGWDSLIENAFAQQPTPNITPRNSMLTNPTIPSITVSTSAERLYEPAPVNSSPAPQSPHTRPESLRKTPSPAQPSTSQQIPKDLTPRPVSPASTATKFSPIPSSLDLPPEEAEDSLDPVWAKVRAKKLEKMMALPSKVKSLEGHIGDLGNIMVGLLNGTEKLGKVQEVAEELEATKAPEQMVQEKMPEIKPVPELATGKVQESQIPRKTSGPKKTIPKKPSM